MEFCLCVWVPTMAVYSFTQSYNEPAKSLQFTLF